MTDTSLVDEPITGPPAAGRTRARAGRPGRTAGGIARSVLRHLPLAWIVLVVLAALLADVLPLSPYDMPVTGIRPRTPPSFTLPQPLGTDVVGRSMLSRLVYGARQSLLIGAVSVAAAMAVGLAIGTAAGYLRGWTDRILGILLDTLLSVPGLVLLLAIASIGQRNTWSIIAGLSLVGVPAFARLARASTLALADRGHVVAARAMGATRLRIVLREVLPFVAGSLSTYAFLHMGTVIVAEGSLGFLGLGVPPPVPSWGGMVNEGRAFLGTHPFLVFVPAACIVLTVAAFTAIGERARRRLDLREAVIK